MRWRSKPSWSRCRRLRYGHPRGVRARADGRRNQLSLSYSAFLIAAQILFAYAFDLLLTWSRRDTATLGFGPFPIVFSTNLFLWFRQDWFYLQLAMIALAFAGKELIRWNRDGKSTHVFNPSAFTLTVFSAALIVTGTSNITRGQDIAITQFYPPHMYLFLFLVALPGQFLFGVTTMTMSAVLATYLFGLGYYALTGTYYFFDSYIPIAVFLGMHLLCTDPPTAPRTDLGRIIFGVLYGALAIVDTILMTHYSRQQLVREEEKPEEAPGELEFISY